LVLLDRAIVLGVQAGSAHLRALGARTHPGEAEAWIETTAAVSAGLDALPAAQPLWPERARPGPPHTAPIEQAAAAREAAAPPAARPLSPEHASPEPPHTAPMEHAAVVSHAAAPHAAPVQHDAGPGLTAQLSREEYLERVRAAKRLIRDGETYEVCLTTRLEG